MTVRPQCLQGPADILWVSCLDSTHPLFLGTRISIGKCECIRPQAYRPRPLRCFASPSAWSTFQPLIYQCSWDCKIATYGILLSDFNWAWGNDEEREIYQQLEIHRKVLGLHSMPVGTFRVNISGRDMRKKQEGGCEVKRCRNSGNK